MTNSVCNIQVCEKLALTLEEASALSNIGVNKLRELTSEAGCDFVLFVGSKRLIKRKRFEQYLDKIYSI